MQCGLSLKLYVFKSPAVTIFVTFENSDLKFEACSHWERCLKFFHDSRINFNYVSAQISVGLLGRRLICFL